MDCQLRLTLPQHELIWKRKSAIETRFKVQIHSPLSRGYTPFNWVYNGFNQKEVLIVAAKGEISNVEAFEKYVTEAIVHPEIIEIFSYPQDLKPIFEDNVWIEIFEEIYNVYASTKTGCEINISGTESSVLSAVSAMEELIDKYNACKGTLIGNTEKALIHKLSFVLRVCKNVDICAGTFDRIPSDVLVLLLSLLEKLYKEVFPVYDDAVEDSALILGIPNVKPVDSVIVLGSDSDDDNDSRCRLGSGSQNILKKKKRRQKSKADNLKRHQNQRYCAVQVGCSSQNPVPQQNGRLQVSQVGSSIKEPKLPIIDNPNFIPLCLKSASNDSTTKVSAKQGNKRDAQLQVLSADAHTQPADNVPVVPKPPKRLRPIVIDGCNVAFYSTKGRREDFSWERIEKSIKYFQDRGHTNIKVFIPQHRRGLCYERSGNQEHVEKLENDQLMVFTPSRRIDGRTVSCYDDRFIVDLAYRIGGVILSNDNYRDLLDENVNWAETIKKRLLMYVFAGDELMIPEDPLGLGGPCLNDFLAFPEGA